MDSTLNAEIEILGTKAFEMLSDIASKRGAFLDDCYLILRNNMDRQMRNELRSKKETKD